MQINVKLHARGIADGEYTVRARGCLVALLSWADQEGELEAYSPFAYIPLNTDGSGRFLFTGGRSIPPEASGVFVRAVTADLSGSEEGYFEIPEAYREASFSCDHPADMRIGLISDLHMTNKPGRIHAVLNRLNGMDVVLLAGDLVNNCDSEQFERLTAAIEETLPDKPVFAVAGNHDIPEGIDQNYRHFEQWLFQRAEGRYAIRDSGNGAYAVMLNQEVELIGINPLYAQKIFYFPEKGAQLKWLRQQLAGSAARVHMIMCHAPLLAHNPQRDSGKKAPYLSQDALLQEIADQTGHVVFLSGHTHLSPNVPGGCVEYDDIHKNIYINDGSVCPVDLKSPEAVLPPQWTDGCFTELVLHENSLEVIMRFLHSEKRISRGYYHIPITNRRII